MLPTSEPDVAARCTQRHPSELNSQVDLRLNTAPVLDYASGSVVFVVSNSSFFVASALACTPRAKQGKAAPQWVYQTYVELSMWIE